MLRLPDSWVWDFWIIRDQGTYHAFFLYASRALRDPELRHRRASIGHAVSTDLVHWERVADALVRGDLGDFDQTATWTGSVVRGDDARWYLFYTGATFTDEGQIIQRIGLATSEDLYTWHRYDRKPLVSADSRWYETMNDDPGQREEHWRDPWVFKDPDGHGWHMLITAQANTGPEGDRGVIGHARSDDLITWAVQPPLTLAGNGFGPLEVLQVEVVDGRPVLIFSCATMHLPQSRVRSGVVGGVWAVAIPSLSGPYPVRDAIRIGDPSLYVGKLVKNPQGKWVMLAFVEQDGGGGFGGYLINPRPVHWDGEELRVAADHDALPAGNRDASVSA